MAKIVGFMKRIDGFQTIKGKMKSDLFINACKKISERTGAAFESYYTKRQCGKFYRGKGIVFNEM